MRIILHAPFPLNPDARAASGIRPVKMFDAFTGLGHEVWLVDGYSRQRRAAMTRVLEAMKSGVRFDLCYSESSTMPTPLTDPDHLPRHPLRDYAFFARLRRAGVPVGVYYRDIYWKFPGYGAALSSLRRQVALTFYRLELRAYRRCTDVVFLPSAEMAPYVGGGLNYRPLPPGHGVAEPNDAPPSPLRLLYVGGMGDRYRMHALVEAVSVAASRGVDVTLTVCCHPEQWAGVAAEYGPLTSDAVIVREASGAVLHDLFGQVNVAVLMVEPLEYWTFAAPVKLFEYIGEGKPVIATEGTLAGRFVTDNDCGWTLPYEVEDAVALLSRLSADPAAVQDAHRRTLLVRERNDWAARARTVIDDLTGV